LPLTILISFLVIFIKFYKILRII